MTEIEHGMSPRCTGAPGDGCSTIAAQAAPPESEAASSWKDRPTANRPPVRPCGCGRPVWSEDAEEEFDAAGAEHDPDRWCPHWCIEDVPFGQAQPGELFALQGDLPLEVSWNVLVPSRGATELSYRPMLSYRPIQGGPVRSAAMADTTLAVLRFGMVGRQTIEPTPTDGQSWNEWKAVLARRHDGYEDAWSTDPANMKARLRSPFSCTPWALVEAGAWANQTIAHWEGSYSQIVDELAEVAHLRRLLALAFEHVPDDCEHRDNIAMAIGVPVTDDDRPDP